MVRHSRADQHDLVARQLQRLAVDLNAARRAVVQDDLLEFVMRVLRDPVRVVPEDDASETAFEYARRVRHCDSGNTWRIAESGCPRRN